MTSNVNELQNKQQQQQWQCQCQGQWQGQRQRQRQTQLGQWLRLRQAGAVATVASILCWPTSSASTAGSINILRTSVQWGAATRRSVAALRKVSAARKMLKNIAYIWEQLLLCRSVAAIGLR